MKHFTAIFIQLLLASNIFAQAGWITLENSPFTSYRHEDLWFINGNTGWLGAGSNGIWRTTDGGTSWQQQSTLTYIRCIGFADSLYGWAGNLNASSGVPIYRTTNGGVNWEGVTLPSPGTSGSCGIWVHSRDVVNIAGKYSGPARFIRTTNSGVSWTVKDMSAYANSLVDCYFYSRDSGFVVGYKSSGGSKGVVLFTPDGGETWQTRYMTSQSISYGWKFTFPSQNTGYASMQTFSTSTPQIFLKTTNAGVNWAEINYTSGIGLANVQGIGFATNTLGWSGLFGSGPTYETTDGGGTWRQVNFGTSINRFRFINDTLGYAAGNKVYKYTTQVVSGTVNNTLTSPDKYKLYQNYPNPFNPSTTISYSVSERSIVSIKVYDMKGKLMSTVVEKLHIPGEYSAVFKSYNLPSGIYFYKLETTTGSIVKQMALIK